MIPQVRGLPYPFQAGRETGASTATKTRCFNFRNNLSSTKHHPLAVPSQKQKNKPPLGNIYVVQCTQSWPLSKISFVLYQSPSFIALFRSAGVSPYRFWKIRSWSASPPNFVLGGGATSLAVARPQRWAIMEEWTIRDTTDTGAGLCRARNIVISIKLVGDVGAEQLWVLSAPDVRLSQSVG